MDKHDGDRKLTGKEYEDACRTDEMTRVVSWFSCGIASAVATKLAMTSNNLPFNAERVEIYNCEIKEEHPDNHRFLQDCEEWFGRKINIVGNDEYGRSTDEVFKKTRFLVGPAGARCTAELKKAVRYEHGRPHDVVVMGYTGEEKHRLDRLKESEPMLRIWTPLIDQGLAKEDCHAIVKRAGLEAPAMYKLGFHNNNCIGCVKGGAGYWNKIRQHFPERFDKMAKIERDLGRTICKREWTEGGKRKLERIYLDEMPRDLGHYPSEPEPQCGFFCHMAEQDIGE